MVQYKILKKLEKKFGKRNVIIFDESKKHALYNREFTHFKIIVISNDFIQKKLLTRHKNIYDLISNIINKYNIHGISIHTYTKNEFININENITSPKCIKNKHKKFLKYIE